MRGLAWLLGLATVLSVISHAQTPPPLLARPPEPPTHTVTADSEEFLAMALSHPTPQYPIDARRRHLGGKGLFHVTVSYETGEVTSVAVESSTGHKVLDDAAVQALRKWKFRPHRITGMKIPITFSVPKKT